MRLRIVPPLQLCHGAARLQDGILENVRVCDTPIKIPAWMGNGMPQARKLGKLDNRDTDDNDITVSGDIANTRTTSLQSSAILMLMQVSVIADVTAWRRATAKLGRPFLNYRTARQSYTSPR